MKLLGWYKYAWALKSTYSVQNANIYAIQIENFENIWRNFELLVCSEPCCLFPAGPFYYPDFGFSPEFSLISTHNEQLSIVYRGYSLEKMQRLHLGWAWNFILALFVYSFLIVDNNDLALIERFSTWWAVRYLVLAFIAFWTGLLSVSLKWTHHTAPWWPETDDLSQISLHSRGLQSLESTVRLKMNP